MAKKMQMFEPKRVETATAEEKPLGIKLELALNRAKVLTRNFQFQGAEMILQKCILFWPEDGRLYVALGKLLCKQSKFFEVARQYKERILTFGRLCLVWFCGFSILYQDMEQQGFLSSCYEC